MVGSAGAIPAVTAFGNTRRLGVTLADAPANDGLLRPGHADKNVLIALGVDLMALDVLLLLANEGPCLI